MANSLDRDSTSRTINFPDTTKSPNIKIHVDKKTKTVTVSSESEQVSDRDGVKFASSSKSSHSFQLPDRVKFETLKSKFENGQLTMDWELEESKPNDDNGESVIP